MIDKNWLSHRSPAAALVLGSLLAAGTASAATMTAYKTEFCGCCDGWIEHAEDTGFTVTAKNIDHQALFDMKQEAGLDPGLASCHTTWVEGYLIEGHVPADAIHRLLEERPDILGLTAPGMPQRSPGMIAGDDFSGFDVLAVDRNGGTEVFISY